MTGALGLVGYHFGILHHPPPVGLNRLENSRAEQLTD